MKEQKGGEAMKGGTNPVWFSLKIGLFAGLFGGVLRWALYEMKFTAVMPGFLLEPFFRHNYLHTIWGIVTGLGSYILFSAVAALLYQAVLGRLRGPWPGLIYGAVWGLIAAVIGPLLGMMEKINVIGWSSLITEFCVFLLWGLFIGYSIAFEFTDEASREPLGAR
ncbi:YqhR family membrane protein [Paenibacillus sp. CAU 1782]